MIDNAIETMELEDFHSTCVACNQLKNAISIVADNAAVDTLIEDFQNFTEKKVLERVKLQQKGLAERAAEIENRYPKPI